jgi:hypothetical protein
MPAFWNTTLILLPLESALRQTAAFISGKQNNPPPKYAQARLPAGACRKSKADKKRRSNLFGKKDTPYSDEDGERGSQRLNYREADKQGEPVFQSGRETA